MMKGKPMKHSFELHDYGGEKEHAEVSTFTGTESAARNAAGRLARKNGGPVDLAYAPDGKNDWNERYVTTAAPSEFHATGYRLERLEN